MRIALVGTRGVPARYGGFETCIEEVGRRLAAAGHTVVVYCRRADGDRDPLPDEYLGMQLVHLPAARLRAAETLTHAAASVAHLMLHPVDAVVLFNAANSPLLPALRARRLPVATHVDGLEWKRAKWGPTGKRYYRAAEMLAVRWSDALIADAAGIRDYYDEEFGAPTELIVYGAPIVTADRPELLEKIDQVQLTPGGYHLLVTRFEPENHVAEAVEGYVSSEAKLPLVVIGSSPYADDYTARVHSLGDERVHFLGAIWDQDLLDQIYACSLTYQHGHSVGGTNPSLLRAIGAGTATNAFDVSFNREVVGPSGRFWSTPSELAELFELAESDPEGTAERAQQALERVAFYNWDHVASDYESLCERLAARSFPRRRPSGRRRSRHTNDDGRSVDGGITT